MSSPGYMQSLSAEHEVQLLAELRISGKELNLAIFGTLHQHDDLLAARRIAGADGHLPGRPEEAAHVGMHEGDAEPAAGGCRCPPAGRGSDQLLRAPSRAAPPIARDGGDLPGGLSGENRSAAGSVLSISAAPAPDEVRIPRAAPGPWAGHVRTEQVVLGLGDGGRDGADVTSVAGDGDG